MPPKASQRSSKGSSQEAKFRDAFNKLCDSIGKAKNKEGVIKVPPTLNTVNEILRSYRKNDTTVDASFISDLVTLLENYGGDLCSRIETPLFSLVIQITLQAEDCLDAERVLYLLATSLLRDTNESQDEGEDARVTGRKSAIGKECLNPVLDYFLSAENPAPLRRWVGILCIQLVGGCDDNVRRLEMGGEDMRRSIGQLVLQEPNEIIKIVCGELVRTLDDAGVTLQDLWPVDTDKSVYDNFPKSTQEGHGWGGRFQTYIDAYDEADIEDERGGPMLPTSSIRLDPLHPFGAPHQNNYMFFDNGMISILAPSLPIMVDQILDIPTSLIQRAIIATKQSQLRSASLFFELASSTDTECCLDGKGINVRRVWANMKLSSDPNQSDPLTYWKGVLKDYCRGAEISEADLSDMPVPNSSEDQTGASQKSGVGEIINSENNLRASNGSTSHASETDAFDEEEIKSRREEFDEVLDHSMTEETQENLETTVGAPANTFDANDDAANPNQEANLAIGEKSQVEDSFSTKLETQSRRGGNKVRPKAKPPIISSTHPSDDKILLFKKIAPKPPVEPKGNGRAQARGDQEERRRDPLLKLTTKSQAKAVNESSTDPANSIDNEQDLCKAGSQLKRTSKTSTKASNLTHRIVTQTKSGAKDNTDRSAKGKPASKPSHEKREVVPIDSDEITSPDPGDTSTPKMMPPSRKQSSKSDYATSQKGKQTSQSQVKKRYSLHSLGSSTSKPSANDSQIYDMPQDDDEDDAGLGGKAGRKKNSVKEKQPSKNSANTTNNTARSMTKPGRKSAPAALENPIAPTRHSQRAAATKAKSRLRDADNSDDEEYVEEIVQGKPRPKKKQKPQKKVVDKMQESEQVEESFKENVEPNRKHKSISKDNAKSKSAAALKKTSERTESLMEREDQGMPEIQYYEPFTSPQSPGLADNFADDEDIYGASPRKAQSKVSKESVTTGKGSTAGGGKRVGRDPAIDMASKLDDILGDLDNNEAAATIDDESGLDSASKILIKEKSSMTSLQADIEMQDAENYHSRETKTIANIEPLIKERPLVRKELPKPPRSGVRAFSTLRVLEPSSGIPSADASIRQNRRATEEKREKPAAKAPPKFDVPEFLTPNNPEPLSVISSAGAGIKPIVEATEENGKQPTAKTPSVKETIICSEELDDDITDEAAIPQNVQTEPNDDNMDKKEKFVSIQTPENPKHVEHATKKRKADGDETASSKRRKSTKVEIRNNDEVFPEPEIKKTASMPGSLKKSRAPKPKPTSPSRRSPRLEKAKKAAENPDVVLEPEIEKMAPKPDPMKKSRVSKPKSPSPSPSRRSPRLEKAKKVVQNLNVVPQPDIEQTAPTPDPLRKFRTPKPKSLSPVRRSPRLEKARNVAENLKDVVQDKILIDDKSHRKPPIISFGAQGPLNQGRSSIQKSVSQDSVEAIQTPERPAQPAHLDQCNDSGSSRKRKQVQANLGDVPSLPSKRRKSRPPQVADDDFEEADPIISDSSPPARREIKSRPNQPKFASRPSSQGSRVDANGSPLAPTRLPVDHIGKLKQKRVQDKTAKDLAREKDHEGELIRVAQPRPRPRRVSDVFGPRITLGAKPKAQPASSEEVTTRYVPHEKTEQGQYTDIASKVVIADEKVVPDPFAVKDRKSSNFTERLLASAVNEDEKAKNEAPKERRRVFLDVREQQVQYGLPRLPCESTKSHPQQEKKSRREYTPNNQPIFNPEQTLVEVKHRHVDYASEPSEMTNGTSYHSESSDSSREPLSERPTPNEEWNMALRPHYKSLSDAVHRIANEVIIRLTDEEDRMGRMLEQYRENGTKIIDNLTKKRSQERATVVQSLDGKKQEMTSIYTKAKEFILQNADGLKQNQINRFEKEWRKKQDDVRKDISEGRKVSE